jgi:hypothetical protein
MIRHPHWWKDTGFNYAFMAVEQQCRICKSYRRWTGKFKDYPGVEWEPGRANRRIE